MTARSQRPGALVAGDAEELLDRDLPGDVGLYGFVAVGPAGLGDRVAAPALRLTNRLSARLSELQQTRGRRAGRARNGSSLDEGTGVWRLSPRLTGSRGRRGVGSGPESEGLENLGDILPRTDLTLRIGHEDANPVFAGRVTTGDRVAQRLDDGLAPATVEALELGRPTDCWIVGMVEGHGSTKVPCRPESVRPTTRPPRAPLPQRPH